MDSPFIEMRKMGAGRFMEKNKEFGTGYTELEMPIRHTSGNGK